MRITFNTKFNQGLDGILNTQKRLLRAQDQLIKQTKILTPADDPSGSAKVLGVGQNLSQLDQYEKNSIAVKNNLGLEETVLTSVRTAMDRARVLALASGNGSYSDSEREAVAQEIEGIQSQLLDLMNSRNVEGGYLFSGFQDGVKAFSLDPSSGRYVFNGDEGQKALQVSPGVTLPINDSGKTVFDSLRVKPTPSTPVISLPGPTTASIDVVNQDLFTNFYTSNYDKISLANNTFSIELVAPSNYQIMRGGVALVPPATGTYTSGQPISFNGLQIAISGPAGVGQVDFTLPAPEKTNILNTLAELMFALKTPGPVNAAFQASVSKAIGEIDIASNSVDSARSALGGRINVMDSITGSNADLVILARQYQADIAEVDFSKVIADLTKEETALQAVQATFSTITKTSLFDYIR